MRAELVIINKAPVVEDDFEHDAAWSQRVVEAPILQRLTVNQETAVSGSSKEYVGGPFLRIAIEALAMHGFVCDYTDLPLSGLRDFAESRSFIRIPEDRYERTLFALARWFAAHAGAGYIVKVPGTVVARDAIVPLIESLAAPTPPRLRVALQPVASLDVAYEESFALSFVLPPKSMLATLSKSQLGNRLDRAGVVVIRRNPADRGAEAFKYPGRIPADPVTCDGASAQAARSAFAIAVELGIAPTEADFQSGGWFSKLAIGIEAQQAVDPEAPFALRGQDLVNAIQRESGDPFGEAMADASSRGVRAAMQGGLSPQVFDPQPHPDYAGFDVTDAMLLAPVIEAGLL